MNDRTRRSFRTLIQGLPPAAIIALLEAFHVPIDAAQAGALMVLLTAVSSFLMNLIEDETNTTIVTK